MDGPATYTIDEIARILNIGRDQAYTAAKNGDIPAVRIGKRLLVPRMALERMLGGPITNGADPLDASPEPAPVRRWAAPSRDLRLRLKEPLRAKIEAAARERGVSMNSEMIARLERSFEHTQRPPASEVVHAAISPERPLENGPEQSEVVGPYTVKEFARLSRLSLNAVYQMIDRNELPSVRLGRAIRIPRDIGNRILQGERWTP